MKHFVVVVVFADRTKRRQMVQKYCSRGQQEIFFNWMVRKYFILAHRLTNTKIVFLLPAVRCLYNRILHVRAVKCFLKCSASYHIHVVWAVCVIRCETVIQHTYSCFGWGSVLLFVFIQITWEVGLPRIRQRGEGGGLNGKRTLNRDCVNVLSGFAVKSPLIKPPPLYVYNHWGFQTDEQEQMSRDQRTFSPADPPDVGKKFFSALTIFLPKNVPYHYRNLVMTLLEKWRLHLQEILYDNQSLKPYFPISGTACEICWI